MRKCGTCSTCESWSLLEEYSKFIGDDWGECVLAHSEDDNEEGKRFLALGRDEGEGTLHTRNSFGCVMWKEDKGLGS